MGGGEKRAEGCEIAGCQRRGGITGRALLRFPESGGGSGELTTGVAAGTRGLVSGLRAASGEDGTRGLVFRATCRLRRGRHEGVGFGYGRLRKDGTVGGGDATGEECTRGLFRATCRLREDGTRGLVSGVPPQERTARGWLVSGLRAGSLREDGRGASSRATPPQERTARGGWFSGLRAASGEDGTRGLVFRATCRLRRGRHEGVSFRATCRLRRGRHEGVGFPGYVPPQERTARGGWFSGLRAASGEDGTRGLVSGLRAASGEDGTRGLVFRATCRLRRGRHEGVGFPGYVPPQERTARGG